MDVVEKKIDNSIKIIDLFKDYLYDFSIIFKKLKFDIVEKFKNKEDQSYANTIIKKVSLIESMVYEITKFAELPNPKFANIKLNTLCYDLILFHRKSNKEINFTINYIVVQSVKLNYGKNKRY